MQRRIRSRYSAKGTRCLTSACSPNSDPVEASASLEAPLLGQNIDVGISSMLRGTAHQLQMVFVDIRWISIMVGDGQEKGPCKGIGGRWSCDFLRRPYAPIGMKRQALKSMYVYSCLHGVVSQSYDIRYTRGKGHAQDQRDNSTL